MIGSFSWPLVVARSERRSRRASSGGVAAKNESSRRSAKSCATSRARTSGVVSSPLLTSTQRVRMGLRPPQRTASSHEALPQHLHSFMNETSSARAARTRSAGSAAPEISPQNSPPAALCRPTPPASPPCTRSASPSSVTSSHRGSGSTTASKASSAARSAELTGASVRGQTSAAPCKSCSPVPFSTAASTGSGAPPRSACPPPHLASGSGSHCTGEVDR